MSWWISPQRLRRLGILGMNCRNVDFIGRYNPRRLYPLVDDKLKTKILAEKHGIPAPQLLFSVREQFRLRKLAELLQPLTGFAVKPAKGSGGKGILVIQGQQDGVYLKASGRRLGLEDVKRHISNILAGLYSLAGTPDAAIVEQLIQLDPRFENYSYQGIPDIRVIVFQGYPVMAMLRLATQASDGKANLHQGAVGVGLDIATGRCLKAVQYSLPLTRHPDTGADFTRLQISDWPELLTMAARCYEVTGLGYLGVDIVLDKQRGPLVLELNARPGLAIQVASEQGLLARLRRLENLDRRHDSVAQRVEFTRRFFAGEPV
ncbi:alpha-L-glutamate ligase-like protein [Desulfurivibrio alkaliphilus]|uniref:Alpha-L-glutamate ligase-like protein n=1 Tax=Desulfurivibrio alkaliphilus (strain DSM 19089 / UNIQEM U267 / AHT2) TaxID=589865 RepID=D6Z6U6_DESAT|nr:alpha-L-glutamate ligase-like protein [Desulfurivibrio alkaliphilus]ADH85055.1 alpha-L-glutamate ligase-like protein [Desulfurivibrio alkaliphilus AHT 2]